MSSAIRSAVSNRSVPAIRTGLTLSVKTSPRIAGDNADAPPNTKTCPLTARTRRIS